VRIFVHEHVSGGGLAAAPLPRSLRTEGWAMLRSIVTDLSRVNAVRSVVTTLDRRLEGRLGELAMERVEVVLSGEPEIERLFLRLAGECDATLVIAPESDGVLLERSRWALESGSRLLGSSPQALELAGDKLALSRLLAARGVPVVPLDPVDLAAGPPPGAVYPAVLKPRWGAGSQWTYLIAEGSEAGSIFERARGAGAPDSMVLGPFVRGLPVSASFLLGPGRRLALLAGTQLLSADGRFQYLGGRMPLPRPLARRALALAERAVGAVEGLSGSVGVDLVLAEGGGSEGESDVVVEVNARLTTSYLGLRALSRGNLAESWLALASGVDVPPPQWYGGAVHFLPDGRLLKEEAEKS
jgi:predicted ATP-grasp superfamily ATP-dependent carboligase